MAFAEKKSSLPAFTPRPISLKEFDSLVCELFAIEFEHRNPLQKPAQDTQTELLDGFFGKTDRMAASLTERFRNEFGTGNPSEIPERDVLRIESKLFVSGCKGYETYAALSDLVTRNTFNCFTSSVFISRVSLIAGVPMHPVDSRDHILLSSREYAMDVTKKPSTFIFPRKWLTTGGFPCARDVEFSIFKGVALQWAGYFAIGDCDYDRAFKLSIAATAEDRQLAGAWYNAGEAKFKLNQAEEAAKYFDIAYRVDPTDRVIARARNKALRALGRDVPRPWAAQA